MPVPTTTPTTSSRVLLRDRIRDRIRDAILDGVLQPGERLLDDELVSWLGCSRTPIREALSDLEHAGFIEIEPNRYTRVAVPRAEEAIEVTQTLGVLFGGAVLLATPRLSRAVLDDADRLIDVCLDDVDRGDPAALNEHYQELFSLFVEHCGNTHLTKVCRETAAGLAYKLRLADAAQIFDLAAAIAPLRDLRAAILGGDAVSAELAAEALHLLHAPRERAGV